MRYQYLTVLPGYTYDEPSLMEYHILVHSFFHSVRFVYVVNFRSREYERRTWRRFFLNQNRTLWDRLGRSGGESVVAEPLAVGHMLIFSTCT